MKKIDLTAYAIARMTNNNGINKEWLFGAAFGIERSTHDHTRYDMASDYMVDGIGYSVKASHFTLMTGSLCEGRTTFDGIWNLYESKVHSDRFVYITDDCTAYIMTLAEFKQLVYEFGRLERDSSKNGGHAKIRCLRESKKMREWFKAQVA